MGRIAIKINPEEYPQKGVETTEALSYAQWGLLMDNSALTRNINEAESKILDTISSPIYDVALWLVNNWWNIFYEYQNENESFGLRHNLQTAGNGYFLPDVEFCRVADFMLVQTKPCEFKYSNYKFIPERDVFVIETLKELQDAFLEILNWTNSRLKEGLSQQDRDDFLYKLQLITSKEGAEQAYCKLLASANLNPFDVSEQEANIILSLNNEMSDAYAAEFFPQFGHNKPHKRQAEIQQLMQSFNDSNSESGIISEIKSELKPNASSPIAWQNGYKLARILRDNLGISDVVSSDYALNKLSIKLSNAPAPKGLTAFSLETRSKYPVFVSTKNHKQSVNFSLARAVYTYLMTTDDNKTLVLDTKTVLQQASRAFAAEFLAPADLIRQLLSNDKSNYPIKRSKVEWLAERLAVSTRVVEMQILNHVNIGTLAYSPAHKSEITYLKR